MPLPSNPTNGQTATLRGITYTYNSTSDSWSISTLYSNTAAFTTINGNLQAPGAIFNGTDSIKLPVGNTAQRPTSATGQIRFNSELTTFEGYNGTSWGSIGLSAGSITTTEIANAAVTPAKLSQPLTLVAEKASTSGTTVEFLSIPSWVKRITVMFNGVSTGGSNNILIQIGASGGFETTGYISTLGVINAGAATQTNTTAGFMTSSQTATRTATGIATVALLGSNAWIYSSVVRSETNVTNFGAGNKTLSGTLDRIRVTSTGSTDLFDAGSISLMYE
jgi:hypothetical protein